MKVSTLRNLHKTSCSRFGQRGQAMVEYVVVCSLVAMVLIVPVNGKRLYVWVLDALDVMYYGYVNGLSVYAFPL